MEQEIVLISVEGNKLITFDANNISEPVSQKTLSHHISSLVISEKNKFAYVSLWDAPDYSVIVLNLPTMETLASYQSTLSTEPTAYKRFHLNQ